MKSLFKFLDSYTREDRAVFFGRDQEITELYRRVFESKMLLVYGISGTGKSSLVNCGLASRFDESDWLPVNVRRGNNIVDSLNDAFNKQAITPLKKTQNITEKLQSIYLDHFKPVYLLFDQFEELFIFGSQEEKEGFISIVKEITESETQCRIIFIIREEFLAGMTEFEEKLPDIFTNRFRVEKMKRTNAISAVEGPCKVFGIETEPGFPEELIDKLCPSGNEIELTYLQIYLDRIFRLATGDRQPATGTQKTGPGTSDIRFSSELLAKAGSVSDLLGQFLDEQIREMENPETGMAILKSFVSVQGTRRQMTETEILNSTGSFGEMITKQDLLRYLAKFVDLRILRERDESGHFELRHDGLASKIYEKFTALEKDIIEVKLFIENAFSDYRKRGRLLTSDDLKYIAPYEERLFLSKSSEAFIQKSRNEILKLRKRRRNIAAGAAIALIVVLSGFTIWALNERKRAFRERTVAETQKENAVAANEKATKAEAEALMERNRALENEEIALQNERAASQAQKEAESSRLTALKSEALALQGKNRALDEQAKAAEALQARIEAESKLEETAKEFVIGPTTMNILYKGIKNPIAFAIPGISSGKIWFTADQRADIFMEPGDYSIIPYTTGQLNINLSRIIETDTILLGTRTFRVKPLPAPVPYVAGKNSGYILKSELVNTDGIRVVTADFDFDVEYEIIGYRIEGELKQGSFVGYSTGNSIIDEVRELFSLMDKGKALNFSDITVIGPDSISRNLGSISLRVVESIPWGDIYIFNQQMDDYIDQKNWEGMRQLAEECIDKYYRRYPSVLNSTAWKFYSYIDDASALYKSLKWSEKAVRLSKNRPEYMNTYASLLFKLGKLDEAEIVEQEALARAKAANKPTDVYENLLKKIREAR